MNKWVQKLENLRSYVPCCADRVRSLLTRRQWTLNRVFDRTGYSLSDKGVIVLLLTIPLFIPAILVIALLFARLW